MPTKTSPIKLRAALDACLQETINELTAHVTRWEQHVHTDYLRKLAGKIEGIRFMQALMIDRHLADARKRADLVEALRLSGVATQTAAFAGLEGFHDGVTAGQTAIAKLIEAIDAAG